MTFIVYLHGFNSAFDPESNKVNALQTIGTVMGITYDSTDSYQNICRYLTAQLSIFDRDDTIIVGTSLGGFWAAEMGFKLNLPSVIINPCYDPTNMLKKYVGPQINFKTGEKKELTLDSVLSYMHCKTYDSDYRYLPLVLLDLGDEVIDSKATRDLFEGFPMVVYAGGNHRFEHITDSLTHIKEYMNYCLFVEHLDT